MSQKNKRITLYKSLIVVLSVLAVLVLLAAIYLFITYEQDKKDNNSSVVTETTFESTSSETNSSTDESKSAETTSSDNSTTAEADNNTTTAAENLEDAAKASKIVNDKVIEEYGANYKDTYYIEDIGLNNDKYVYCLRRSEDTYAQKWYYVNAKTYELTEE